MDELISVACAILKNGEKIFAAKRRTDQFPPDCWELPGGKIELNETPSAAIKRELLEELAMHVCPEEEREPCEHDYGKFQVRLFPIICSTSSQTFTLREHADAGWFTIEECSNLKWSAADIPILEKYVLKGGRDELLVGKS